MTSSHPEILERCRVELNLEYSPGIVPQTTGVVLLGLLPFVSRTLAKDIRSALASGTNAVEIPSIKVDPLGYAVAARPLCDSPDSVLKGQSKMTKDYNKWFRALPWNLHHIVFGHYALMLLSATCKVNGFTGKSQITNDPVLVHRFRQQTFYVLLDPITADYPLSIDVGFKDASLSEGKSRMRINNNWQKPHIFRRPREDAPRDINKESAIRLTIAPQIRNSFIQNAIDEEMCDRASVETALASDRLRKNEIRHRKSLRTPIHVHSALPPLDGITETQMSKICTYALEGFESDAGALSIALHIAGAVGDVDLNHTRIFKIGNGYFLATPCPFIQREMPVVGADLHIEAKNQFVRPIPVRLARAMICAQEKGLSHTLAYAQEVSLRKRFQTTPAKLRHALRFQTPVWYKMPWTYYDVGLVPVRFDDNGTPHMPGYRHYLTWDLKQYTEWLVNSLPLLGWRIPTELPLETVACGSLHTPTLSAVCEMAKTLNSLISLAKTNPPYKIPLLNAISALVRLFECLFSFTRNYPTVAPTVVVDSGRPIILEDHRLIKEKIRERIILYPKSLKNMLGDAATAFHLLCHTLEADGCRIEPQPGNYSWESYAYGFLNNSAPRHLQFISPRKSLIRSGLLNYQETEQFGMINLNCMRNLAYYLLTAQPEHQLTVMALCDHRPTGDSGSLNPESGASILDTHMAESACQVIAQTISWPW